jgi:hypothetical protein
MLPDGRGPACRRSAWHRPIALPPRAKQPSPASRRRSQGIARWPSCWTSPTIATASPALAPPRLTVLRRQRRERTHGGDGGRPTRAGRLRCMQRRSLLAHGSRPSGPSALDEVRSGRLRSRRATSGSLAQWRRRPGAALKQGGSHAAARSLPRGERGREHEGAPGRFAN